jgi:hypothetical protein
MSTTHVAAMLVILLCELNDEMIQIFATKSDEVRQALAPEGPDEVFTATFQIGIPLCEIVFFWTMSF